MRLWVPVCCPKTAGRLSLSLVGVRAARARGGDLRQCETQPMQGMRTAWELRAGEGLGRGAFENQVSMAGGNMPSPGFLSLAPLLHAFCGVQRLQGLGIRPLPQGGRGESGRRLTPLVRASSWAWGTRPISNSKPKTSSLLALSSGDTIPNCWGEFREIRKSKERRGIAASGHPAGTPGPTGVERLRPRENGQRLGGGEWGETD